MSEELGTRRIKQLIEIDEARRRNGGASISPEVDELIHRLTSGGIGAPKVSWRDLDPARAVATDTRLLTQAKVLWDKGWARVMSERGIAHYERFADYAASLPPIPNFPATWDERFPHLVLVDKRPFLRPEHPFALEAACDLLGVKHDESGAIVPYDPNDSPATVVYWMRCQNGDIHRDHKQMNRRASCRGEFTRNGDEVGLTAFEGLSAYAQNPGIVGFGAAMDLPGSVRFGHRGYCAFLARWSDNDVQLSTYWGDADYLPLHAGAASRGSETPNPRT